MAQKSIEEMSIEEFQAWVEANCMEVETLQPIEVPPPQQEEPRGLKWSKFQVAFIKAHKRRGPKMTFTVIFDKVPGEFTLSHKEMMESQPGPLGEYLAMLKRKKNKNSFNSMVRGFPELAPFVSE